MTEINIPWLEAEITSFPDIDRALDEPNGLLCVGGDLSPARLLKAYRHGIFPWYEDPQPILWWSPHPRAVLFPERVHIGRTLKKALRREDYTLSSDRDYEQVLESCARLSPKRPGTWITHEMKQAYLRLFDMGWGHSIEVWRQGRLIGGLYGVAIGRMFYGESMFSTEANGSKIALVALCEHLRSCGYALIDCQVGNPYLYSMGAEDINRDEFRGLLQQHSQPGLKAPGRWYMGDIRPLGQSKTPNTDD